MSFLGAPKVVVRALSDNRPGSTESGSEPEVGSVLARSTSLVVRTHISHTLSAIYIHDAHR